MVIKRVSVEKQRTSYQYMNNNRQVAYNFVPATPRYLENSQDKF